MLRPATIPLHTNTAYAKIAHLNQYYAGQGVEFVFENASTPLVLAPAPERRLLAINDFTGAAAVANHDVDLTITIAITVAGVVHNHAVAVRIAANTDPPTAGGVIKAAISTSVLGGALAGIALDADVYDFPDPRLYLSFNNPGRVPPALGVRGPTDVVIRQSGGAPAAKLEIAALAAVDVTTGAADTAVDFFVPPVDRPFHDPNFNPPCAATRHWVRTYGAAAADYVSLVIEPVASVRRQEEATYTALCQAQLHTLYDADLATMLSRFTAPLDADLAGSTSPYAILKFGRWAEDAAQFISFLPQGSYSEAANDVMHEVGHALADVNHTPVHPAWFYENELMQASGPQGNSRAVKMTRHKILVDVLDPNGGWHQADETCARGYGGRVRDQIAQRANAWVITTPRAPGQPPW